MGSSASAHLAYGYDLGGTLNGWKLQPVDEHGFFDFEGLGWVDEDEEDAGFGAAAELRLLAELAGFTEGPWPGTDGDGYFDRQNEAKKRLGLQFDFYGPVGESSYVLAAHIVERDWCEGLAVDLAALAAMPAVNGWDGKLNAAIQALGITPAQERPAWLLCADYG